MPVRNCTYYDHRRRARCTECNADISLCQCEDPDYLARERLTSRDGQMMVAIRNEIRQARAEFPHNHYMLPVLVEEMGRLAKAIVEHSLGKEVTTAEVFQEAVQVAVMTIRLATEGDADFSYNPDTLFPEGNT